MDADFFHQVYQVVRKVPYGRVTSYGAIAKYLGSAKSSRMVGWALNKCSTQKEYVPAHRVLNRNGLLTGKKAFQGEKVMKELLESEGISVIDDQVQDFKRLFWDPSELDNYFE
ncbi:MGMT family protein [Labilibacter sediminis]|nr:MGMT family protein [Labilibacter sediminis]